MKQISAAHLLAALALTVACCVFFRLGSVAVDHLIARFDLVYETPNLATVRAIRSGLKIYDPEVYGDVPFIITMYTPAYHLLVAHLPQVKGHPFLTGRLVSMCFMLLAGCILFLPGRPERSAIIPILALAAFFCIRPVVSNTAFLRNDSMALFFSVLSVTIVAGRQSGTGRTTLAALTASLAFLSKQSYLTGGVSCFLYLALTDRKQAAVFAGCVAACVGAAFATAWAFCGGQGVWFSLFVAPRNPLSEAVFLRNWVAMVSQPVFLLLLTMATLTVLAAIARAGLRAFTGSPFLIYWAVALFTALPVTAKVGAETNNFFDLSLASLLWLVYCLRSATPASLVRSDRLGTLLTFCMAVALELLLAPPYSCRFVDRRTGAERDNHIREVRSDLSRLGMNRPLILNLSDHWITYSITDCCYVNDPVLYSVLWEDGVLSKSKLIESIKDKKYDLIILSRKDGEVRSPAQVWAEAAAVADSSYGEETDGAYRYLRPACRDAR
jgi:hypothetical protein